MAIILSFPNASKLTAIKNIKLSKVLESIFYCREQVSEKLNLMMTSAQVVETSVITVDSSPS